MFACGSREAHRAKLTGSRQERHDRRAEREESERVGQKRESMCTAVRTAAIEVPRVPRGVHVAALRA